MAASLLAAYGGIGWVAGFLIVVALLSALAIRIVPEPAVTLSSSPTSSTAASRPERVNRHDAAWCRIPTSFGVFQKTITRHTVQVRHLPSVHSPFLSMPGAPTTQIEHEIEEFTP